MPRNKTNKDTILVPYKTNEKWYLRITPVSTQRFSHGIALATQFDSQVDVERFKDDVFEYLKSCFGLTESAVGGLYPTLDEIISVESSTDKGVTCLKQNSEKPLGPLE